MSLYTYENCSLLVEQQITAQKDSRNDLGYGTTKEKFHRSRSLGSTFPYVEKSRLETQEDDIEVSSTAKKTINKKILRYTQTDSLPHNDPFYFAAGNTKLSDCFWRINKVLKEVAAFSDSMTPVPQAYKHRGPSMTGYTSAAPYPGAGGANYKRTGSLKGWSKSPPEVQFYDEESDLADEDPIYTLKDLSKKLKKEE